jgi:16S rRNA (guanine966-N2)-methyltransferase
MPRPPTKASDIDPARARPAPRTPARGAHARELRIIAGMWRGRRWRFPEGEIRPTGDRVRETLYNWLQQRVAGRHCLDLYAGSGALGLEALSRGAAHCVFVDTEPRVLRALRALLLEWRAEPAAADLVESPAQRYFARAPRPFELVFLDPPFAAGELKGAIARLEQPGWLAPGALIYIEQPRNLALPELPPTWQLLRSGTAGAVGYHLCERSAREGQPP